MSGPHPPDGGTGMALAYFPGSPFARMARVLIAEWALPVTPVEQTFPPDPELDRLNPLGQVPVLTGVGEALFPTFLILERLWEMAGRPDAAYRPEADRQVLMTVLQAGDALTTALYQDWCGLRATGPNHIGYDLGERLMDRFGRVLDWLDGMAATGRLRPGVTLPGVAVACLLSWSGARGGPDWTGRPALWPLVRALEGRASFRATVPQPWSPG